MSEGPVQSRKICFVELEEKERELFLDQLGDHEVAFRRSLAEVPEDAEIISLFIGEKVDEAFLDAHPALRLIASRSSGHDHIDLDACRDRQVIVTNIRNYGENTVAEHTFSLILALSRRLRQSHEAVRSGRFQRERLRGFDLRGKTLGVVGTGRVGLHVIRMASAFGMRIVAYDISPNPFFRDLFDFEYVPFEELMRRSRIVTLHVPLTASTRQIVDRESLALCQPRSILINTARGGLLDLPSVIEALDEGRLAGLGLDVLEDERVFQGGAASILGAQIASRVHNASPSEVREFSSERLEEFTRIVTHSRLLNRSDVVLTPHVAFNSDEAVENVCAQTLDNILNYINRRPLAHVCT